MMRGVIDFFEMIFMYCLWKESSAPALCNGQLVFLNGKGFRTKEFYGFSVTRSPVFFFLIVFQRKGGKKRLVKDRLFIASIT